MTFPVNLLIKDKPCLLVGGGKVGAHKAGILTDAGARVTIVAPRLAENLQAKLGAGLNVSPDTGSISWMRVNYDTTVLKRKKWALVVSATDNRELEAKVIKDAKDLGIPVSSATLWQEGNFIFPASFRKGGFQISISTDGQSCKQSKLLREKLESYLNELLADPEWHLQEGE